MINGTGGTRGQREPSALRDTVKIVLFCLLLFLEAAFQSSFFPTAAVFPAIPDIILSAVLGIALFDGEKSAAACGIAGGVFLGALGAEGAGILPVFYFAAGYFAAVVAGKTLKRNLVTWSVFILAAAALRSLITAVRVVVTEVSATLPAILLGVLLPEFILTLVFSYPNYLLTRLAVRVFSGGAAGTVKQND